MKFIISESQQDKFINHVIQETINELRNVCEDYDDATAPGEWYNWDDCDLVENLEKINVVKTEKVETKPNLQGKNYPRFRVWVDIYYSSIFPSLDYENLRNVINYRVFQKYKMDLIINSNEEWNTMEYKYK